MDRYVLAVLLIVLCVALACIPGCASLCGRPGVECKLNQTISSVGDYQ